MMLRLLSVFVPQAVTNASGTISTALRSFPAKLQRIIQLRVVWAQPYGPFHGGLSREARLQQLRIPGRHLLDVIMRPYPLGSRLHHPHPQRLIIEEIANRVSQSPRVSERNKKPTTPPIENFPAGRNIGGDYRHTRSHRFDHGHAEAFTPGCVNHNVTSTHQLGNIVSD